LYNDDFEGRVKINGTTLIIENVNKNDSGTYSCAEDAGHGKEHNVVLTVHGKFSQ